ncbi:MAG: VOC family protein [Syntrophorhabdales bacterium]|jgi:catechol 2,3-dioxygenase-like lactoylglutathione lyase family enzyme
MIRSAEHFSFTVSNLEDTLHFFCDLLGLEATPIIDVEDEGVQKIIGMPGASLRISNVQIPDKKSIELIEYVKPKGKAVDLNTSNPGVAHIAFSVDTIDQMYEDLSKKGVAFVSPPVWAPGNDGKGRWAVCYLRGPDGITLELIERQA